MAVGHRTSNLKSKQMEGVVVVERLDFCRRSGPYSLFIRGFPPKIAHGIEAFTVAVLAPFGPVEHVRLSPSLSSRKTGS